MADHAIALIDQPDRVRLALSPLRRQLLERLRTPASASQIAAELTLGRQRVNYHLRALEHAGLLELVEERQRRGCTERVLVTRARLFVVDPAVVNATESRSAPAPQADAVQDRFAVEHLINSAAAIVRDVARMQTRAQEEGTRLLTFTIDTELELPTPADLEQFANKLAAFVAREAAALGSTPGSRRYRLVIGAHPAPSRPTGVHDEAHRSRPRRTAHRRPH